MKTPAKLKHEFDGGSQKDWIIYDEKMTKLFCIAIWTKTGGGWVLGEYVNSVDPAEVLSVAENGYMTMLEAAKWRTQYWYMIARHGFDVQKDVIESPYWQGLVPDLAMDLETSSPDTPIKLAEFQNEMQKLVGSREVVWTNMTEK